MADPIQFSSEDEFKKFLLNRNPEPGTEQVQQPVAGATPPGALPIIGNLPNTIQALTESRVDRILREDARPGVPLQINPPQMESADSALGNVSPWIRFQTNRRQNLKDQEDYLKSKFPLGAKKATSSDDWIVTVPDPTTGKERDILLNEQEISLGDLGALAAHVPEMAMTLMTMAGTEGIGLIAKAPGLLRALGLIGFGAVGQKLGEAGQQIETRIEQGTAPDILGTLKEKGGELPGQVAMDSITLGTFKGISSVSRLARGGAGIWEGPLQQEGKAAIRSLELNTGKSLSYSAGEASGSPWLIFLEAYTAAKPQATHGLKQFKEAQMLESRAMAEALTSKTGTDEEIGRQLLDTLEMVRTSKESGLAQIRNTMTQQESNAMTRALGKVAALPIPFHPSLEGGNFRSAYKSIYDAVKGKVKGAYADAYSVPGAMVDDVPTKPFVDEIKFLMDQFPTVEGSQWLRQYAEKIPEKEAYLDIVNRRADLWNRISEIPADRSTKDYVHGQLSKSMTETLDDASKNIINPAFRGKIQAANAIYKKSELPFYQEGMHDALMKSGERGSPENIELLNRFQKNTDLYRRLVEVSGKDSVPVKIVQSSILDGLITRSGTSAIDPKFIDGQQLAKNLLELKTDPNTREMFNDVFGKHGESLLAQAKVLGAIQGSIPREEAEAMLKGGGPKASVRRLDTVLKEQDQLNQTYTNTILDGRTDLATVNAEEFVNRFIPKSTASQFNFIIDVVRNNPALLEKLQDKQVEIILGKAGTFRTWNKTKIEEVLNDPNLVGKYKELLGGKFKEVADFAKGLGPRQYADETAEGTGMLVKGQSIGQLARVLKPNPNSKKNLLSRLVEEAPPWIGWKLTGRFLTNPSFREWAGKSFPAEYPNLIKAAILSEPVLEDLSTSNASPEILRNVTMSLRDYLNRVSAQTGAAPDQNFESEEQFKDFLKQRRQ